MVRKLLITSLVLSSTSAFAHISIGSGTAQAGKANKITFNISHGCTDTTVDPEDTEDTYEISVDIPEGFSGVRPLRSDFGRAVVTRNGSGDVTRITWTKAPADEYADDDLFYEITFRATPPPAFTKHAMVITQKCRVAGGGSRTVVWDDADHSDPEPAPILYVGPGRLNNTGWNKVTVPANTTVPVADFGRYFGDALIVWRGTQAFSPNPHTKTQIEATSGVTLLDTDLAANDELWVRY